MGAQDLFFLADYALVHKAQPSLSKIDSNLIRTFLDSQQEKLEGLFTTAQL